MPETASATQSGGLPEENAQPLALKDFFKTISAVRRQYSVYGCDHPSSQRAIEDLANSLRSFLECFGPSTLVLTDDAVVLNDRWFAPSADSRDLFERLRQRGAMAFTVVSEPPHQQLVEFLLYLYAEPRDVRAQGGANMYLRRKGVTCIVATDALFTSGEDGTEGEGASPPADQPSMDRAVAAVITWLTRQDEEEESPPVRVSELFADPDAAARLIREAVTKLHSSSKGKKQAELAVDVVNDLKDLAAGDKEDWDKAAPQMRKAISKLPGEMRPNSYGACHQDVEIGTAATARVPEVEAAVNDLLMAGPVIGGTGDEIAIPNVEKLFGAQPNGLLSNWMSELQPTNTIRSYAETLSMLMGLENNASTHAGIARSLADLITDALEADQPDVATLAAGHLVKEANLRDQTLWRVTNARSALHGVDLPALKRLAEEALATGSHEDQDAAGGLVRTVPQLAVAVAERLSPAWSGHFRECLKDGLSQAGAAAGSVLAEVLRSAEPPARMAALEMLRDIGADWSLARIEAGLRDADAGFLVQALETLRDVRSAVVSRLCEGLLAHRSPDVRLAAVRLLGQSGSATDAATLTEAVTGGSLRRKRDEQIEAIKAIGKIGAEDVLEPLRRIAGRRPVFGRAGYARVAAAANQAIEQIEARLNPPGEKAA